MYPQQQALLLVAAAGAAEAAEEKTEFDVELTQVGPNKVKVIKVVRESQVLVLKRLKKLLMVLRKWLKRALPKQRLRTSKLNLRLRAQKLPLKIIKTQLELKTPIRSIALLLYKKCVKYPKPLVDFRVSYFQVVIKPQRER